MTSKTNDTTEWYEVELARRFIDARTCAKSILFRIIGTGELLPSAHIVQVHSSWKGYMVYQLSGRVGV